MAGQRYQDVYADFDAAAASYPTDVLVPVEFFDRADSRYSPAAITFTVPASSPYKVRLHRVASQADVTVTVESVARTVVLGSSPAAGQVGWDLATGTITFHSSDAGGAASVTLTNVVDTVISCDFLHRLQKEVAATQEEVDGLDTVYQPLNSDLTAIAALGGQVNQVLAVGNTPGAYEYAPLTSWARTLIDDANASAARTTLGLGTMATQSAAALTADVVPSVDDTVSLGSGSKRFLSIFSRSLDVMNAATLGDLTLTGEVLSDLVMGAGTDMHLSNTGKFYFSPTGYFGRGSSDAQLSLRGSLSASGSILGSSVMWVYHGDSGADAVTWLGAENSSSTGSAETNIFGRFRNASNSPVAQFLAFRGTDRTAGSEDGEIVARPLVNGALRDVAKFSSTVSLLPKEKVLIAPDSTYTGAALEIDVDHASAAFLDMIGTSQPNLTGNISTLDGTGAVVGPKADGGGDSIYWSFGEMAKIKINGVERWIATYAPGA